MAKKDFKGLGDLLDGLSGDNDPILEDLAIESNSCIDISKIQANPHQPRFEEDVQELKDSIHSTYEELLKNTNWDYSKVKPEDGLLQPILVSKNEDDTYTCVGGHRRLRACRILKHKTIKANVVQLSEVQLLTFSIVENLQRVELTPFETALAVDKAICAKAFDSEGELASALGKTSAWLSKCKSVLLLPYKILDDLHKDRSKIGLEILSDLQRLKNDETKEDLYFAYKEGKIKSKDIREAIKEEKEGTKLKKPMFSRSGDTLKIELDCSAFLDGDILDVQDEIVAFVKSLKEKNSSFLTQPVEQPFIKCFDCFKKDVYIEYDNGDCHTVTYARAKGIFNTIYGSLDAKASVPDVSYINACDSGAGCDFVNTLPNWKQNGSNDKRVIRWAKK